MSITAGPPETLTIMGSKQRNQIVMADEEITEFVARSRTGTMATLSLIHI